VGKHVLGANTPASKKAKGNRAERRVAELYRKYDIDPKATRMPMSGAMTHFKGDIWKPNDFGYVDEVKNQEKVKLWEWWSQAESQAVGMQTPVLHITGNHRPILTVITIEEYMNLRATVKQLQETIDNIALGE